MGVKHKLVIWKDRGDERFEECIRFDSNEFLFVDFENQFFHLEVEEHGQMDGHEEMRLYLQTAVDMLTDGGNGLRNADGSEPMFEVTITNYETGDQIDREGNNFVLFGFKREAGDRKFFFYKHASPAVIAEVVDVLDDMFDEEPDETSRGGQ